MPVEEAAFPELELVDRLIGGLEALIHESDETPLSIESSQQARRAVYRILAASNPSDRKSHTADAIYLDSAKLVLRCSSTEVVRLTPLEVVIQAEKTGRGETMALITGKAHAIKRVRGGYDVEIEIREMHKTRITPGQKLRECLNRTDAAAWNRWCQDIRDGMLELVGMDLTASDLSGYDLCCADLSGSDLSGANLTGAILAGANLTQCAMDKATVTGADFFRARMRKGQASLVRQSGMPEVESVVYED